ncbi:thioesterase II family protein [Nonomuraea sp. NPDC050556]|uniref:thioesterase II family protein n=1 Tax=Nonomuraea sp. NPDC050556 TaxID=3364369 RepID=UPI0037886082
MTAEVPTSAETWLRRYVSRPFATHTLYCFPYAGGSAGAFRDLALACSEQVDVAAIQLPGRADRYAEAPRLDIGALGRDLARALSSDAAERSYAFLGHSMGALIAYETAHSIATAGGPPPALFVASAASPPSAAAYGAFWASRTDDDLLGRMGDLGGLPPEASAYPELLQITLQTMRADLQLIDSYQDLTAARPRLDCPALVLGGVDDPLVVADALEEWTELFHGPAVVRRMPGGHFYLTGAISEVARIVTRSLTEGLND